MNINRYALCKERSLQKIISKQPKPNTTAIGVCSETQVTHHIITKRSDECLPYVESITATGGIFTDENGNKDVFMGCINGCSATLTQCEYTCGRYYTCDTVAVANDLLRDDEKRKKENN